MEIKRINIIALIIICLVLSLPLFLNIGASELLNLKCSYILLGLSFLIASIFYAYIYKSQQKMIYRMTENGFLRGFYAVFLALIYLFWVYYSIHKFVPIAFSKVGTEWHQEIVTVDIPDNDRRSPCTYSLWLKEYNYLLQGSLCVNKNVFELQLTGKLGDKLKLTGRKNMFAFYVSEYQFINSK